MQRFLIYLFLQMLYMFQAASPPIIRSTKLYIQLQVLSTKTAACCYRGWNSGQCLKLYAQLCAPDDGRWNRLKHVERL